MEPGQISAWGPFSVQIIIGEWNVRLKSIKILKFEEKVDGRNGNYRHKIEN